MRRVREIRIEGDLAFIPLSRGLEAVIDAVDVPLAAGRNWYALKACRTFYAVSKTSSLDGPRQLISLHRTICPSTEVTDHRDGNGLNCRRSNLRAASIAQNAMNRRRPANASPGLKGVTFHRQCQAWQAQINESSTPNIDATFEQLKIFVAKADAEKRPSLGTAAMITWEWLQRGEHVFGAFEVAHYRPKERPDAVQIVHPKTGKEVWWPLFDPEQSERVPLFPELMARLDEIKRNRIGGLMLVRDWKDDKEGRPLPWPTGKKGDLTYMRHEVKRIILAAGLPENLSFTSFRHGGLTETGDADMTDREILAQSAQTTAKVLPRYVKKTMRQVANGARKRRAVRTDGGQMSE